TTAPSTTASSTTTTSTTAQSTTEPSTTTPSATTQLTTQSTTELSTTTPLNTTPSTTTPSTTTPSTTTPSTTTPSTTTPSTTTPSTTAPSTTTPSTTTPSTTTPSTTTLNTTPTTTSSTTTPSTTTSSTTTPNTTPSTTSSTTTPSTTTPSTTTPSATPTTTRQTSTPSTTMPSTATPSTKTPSTTIAPMNESEFLALLKSFNDTIYDDLMAMIDATTEISLDTVILENNSDSSSDAQHNNVTDTSKTLSAINNYKSGILSNNTEENVTNLFTSSPKSIPINLDESVNQTVSSDTSTSRFTTSISTAVRVSYENVKPNTETFSISESSHANTSDNDTLHLVFNNTIDRNSTSQIPIIMDNVSEALLGSEIPNVEELLVNHNNTKGTETISLLDVRDQLANSSKLHDEGEMVYINKTGLMVESLQKEIPNYAHIQHSIHLQPNSSNISTEKNDLQGSDSILIRVKTAGPQQTDIANLPPSQILRKNHVKQKINNISPAYLHLLSDPLIVEINGRPSTNAHQNVTVVSNNTNIELKDTLSSDNHLKSLDTIRNTSILEDNVKEFIAGKDKLNIKE
ncbi:unnamed protein product, partial [Meganyctiphanes norvegica]